MTTRIALFSQANVSAPKLAAKVAPSLKPAKSFAAHLQTPQASSQTNQPAASSAAPALHELAQDLDQQRQSIDHMLAQAQSGRAFSPAELIALQARVYAYNQNMEVVSSLLEKTLSAVKTTLNTQV